MNFFKRFRRQKVQPKPIRSGQVAYMLFPPDEQPQYNDKGFTTFVKDGYSKNELIFACIDLTASTAASLMLKVKDKKTKEVIDDNELCDLLCRPNPLMSEYGFWRFTITMLLIAGCAYWQKVRDSQTGKVIALWPMRPDWVQPVPGDKDFIAGYLYGKFEDKRVLIKFEDVIDFGFYDPRNLYKMVSPTAIAARVGDTDNKITDFIALFFERGAVLQGILTSKLKLDDTDITDIRKRWSERYGGYDQWYNAPAVLDSDATYQAIGNTFKDMDFGTLDERDETRICMVYHIDPIIVGTRFGLARSTLNNIESAEAKWWRNSLKPLYKMLSDEINIDLVYEYGDNLCVEWDYSEISVLQEDRNQQFERANKAVVGGWYTVNMALEEIGHETLDPAIGDVFLWTPATTPVHIDHIAERIMMQMDNSRMANEAMRTANDTAVNTDNNTEQDSNPDNSGKSLSKTITGQPLPHDEAVSVEDYSQLEIDNFFDQWRALPKKP